MDISDPATLLAGGLTVPLLRALSSRASPATAAQLRRAAAAGTEAGVRRALDRLALHGLVTTEEIGDRIVYLLNRDHVLYPAATALLRAERRASRAGCAERYRPGWFRLSPRRCTARRRGGTGTPLVISTSCWSGPRACGRGSVSCGMTRSTGCAAWCSAGPAIDARSLIGPLAALRRLSRAREPIVDEWRKDAVSLAGADVSQLLGQA